MCLSATDWCRSKHCRETTRGCGIRSSSRALRKDLVELLQVARQGVHQVGLDRSSVRWKQARRRLHEQGLAPSSTRSGDRNRHQAHPVEMDDVPSVRRRHGCAGDSAGGGLGVVMVDCINSWYLEKAPKNHLQSPYGPSVNFHNFTVPSSLPVA
jgi:hypothetical protein